MRLAVVGVGGISRKHIEAIRELDVCELAAVCDVEEERAKAASSEHGVPGYAKLDEMLSKEKPDAITVCTPHWSHPAVACAALAAGVHVLTEKPMAVTVEDAERMTAEAKEAGKILAVVFQHRTDPVNAAARKIVESGDLGRIRRTLLVNATFRPDAYFRTDEWRGTWKGEGGGVLVNQAPHALDLFLWISGTMPDRVTGEIETVMHEIEVEDRASALLHYPDGATGYVHCSTAESPGTLRIEIAGEKGKLVVDGSLRVARLAEPLSEFCRKAQEKFAKPDSQWEDVDTSPPEGVRTGHARVIEDFCEAVRDGREPMVTGEEGMKGLELANAIVFSSHRRETLDLPVPRRAYSEFMGLLTGRPPRRRRRRTTARVPDRPAERGKKEPDAS